MNINSLTIKAQEVLQSAMNLASGNGNQAVEPLHILSAIVAEDDSLGVFLLQKLGVNVGALRSVLKQQIDRLPKVEGGDPYFSRESSAVIQKASDFTKTFGDKYASVEHLLLGIIAEKGEAGRLLKDAGATEKELIAAIKELRKGSTVDSQTSEQEYDALGKYAINLNEQARKGKLDPVIGRDEEIRRVLQILSRRTKNNPILVGEPGVGKTAIAEGIAHRIVDGELPQWMSQLRFEDTPLEHVLYIISGFFGVKIDLAAELELEGNFTAAFEEGPTLDNVLLTLQNTVPDFNYRIDGNTVRITEKQVRDEKISK